MALSKMEIQQMLREMNVTFPADASYAELKKRLQQAHHSQWLQSVSEKRSTGGQRDRALVRKRKKTASVHEPVDDAISGLSNFQTSSASAARGTALSRRRSASAFRARAIDKPAPGKPWKAAADGTEPFNRKKKVFESVLRRSRRCCEGCGSPSDHASGGMRLKPYHIIPLDQGGEHSVKNVVALCAACIQAMQNDADPKVVKALKRKARARIYHSLQVIRKKKAAARRKLRRG
ncbi:MAG: HNH endonuclease [Desulfosarcina sp.]|jgi:hypothetical protein